MGLVATKLLAACALIAGCGDCAERAAPAGAAEVTEPSAPPDDGVLREPLALHMRDRLALLTQARDAVIRGRLVDATPALTWLVQHREPALPERARPFLDRAREHARKALDTADLRVAAIEIGGLAATCGDCHRAYGKGPVLPPSGLEDLEDEFTVATHMHGYLWATETLWNALTADPALWRVGVGALSAQKVPKAPESLAAGFSAIGAWASASEKLESSAERAHAYGELLATCANCHLGNGIDPAAPR